MPLLVSLCFLLYMAHSCSMWKSGSRGRLWQWGRLTIILIYQQILNFSRVFIYTRIDKIYAQITCHYIIGVNGGRWWCWLSLCLVWHWAGRLLWGICRGFSSFSQFLLICSESTFCMKYCLISWPQGWEVKLQTKDLVYIGVIWYWMLK